MALEVIDLRKGSPAPDLLPVGLLRRAFSQILDGPELAYKALDYGPGAGSTHVREAISSWLCRRYSLLHPLSARVSVSGGASQNLACILQSYTDPAYTTRVYLVAPTYHLASNIFEDHGFGDVLRAVPEDDQGIDVGLLEFWMREESNMQPIFSRPSTRNERTLYRSIVYCVPSFSNPSGTSMTYTRREQLVHLARKYDALVVSDDVYDFLDWSAERVATAKPPMPRLVDIDAVLDGGPKTPFGNAVSNGSFSKLLGPGLRAGWAEGTPAFILGLSLCGSSVSGGPPSQLTAWLAAASILNGDLDRHIDYNLIPALQRRSRTLLDAVKTHLMPLGVEAASLSKSQPCISGGYFLYLRLPKDVDATLLCDRAERDIGLLLACGESFAVKGDNGKIHGRDCVRLCFAWESEDLLVDGVRRMAALLATQGHRLILQDLGTHS